MAQLQSIAEILEETWPDTFKYNPDRDINRIRALLRNPRLWPDQQRDLKRKLNQLLREAYMYEQAMQRASG